MFRYAVAIGAVLALGLHGGSGISVPDAVEIHPQNLTSLDVAPYSTNTQRFWIVNSGDQANQYSIFANVCSPYDLYCDWSNTFLGTIAAKDSVPFDVTFTAGHAGTTGTISFDARISTNQAVRATKNVTVNARQEMHLEVNALNPGAVEERDLCVTVAVATDAAYECGDLRLVHALPSVRARGTVRTPTLLYNSRFAHPFGLVQATLSVLPQNVTNVTARLRVPRPSGDIVVSQAFSDALFTASSVKKFTLGFDASALPSGVYPYTLTATFSRVGTPDSLSVTGELLVVNRKTSPFGAGWWLAGYERIYAQPDGSLLWVGGDGSARHYTTVATNVFKAPAIDRPDSITVESGNFVRHLRSGAKVEFAPDGKHFATSDRLGLVTFFHHDQYGQMVHIDPAGFGSLRYDFIYSSSTGPLATVTAPSVGGTARVVQRYVLPDGRILSHTDPDNSVIEFRFDNGSIPEQITRRINRRGVIQSFAFDAVGKFTSVRVPLNTADTAVTTFCPAESRGFVSTGCSTGPLHPDSAVTTIDGPRTDVTDVTSLRLNRFGAPKLIRDALGNQTQLFRGNRTFPGLVTRVVYANGWTNDAYHDAKGLIVKHVQYAPLGPNRDAVTEYSWDPKWERVTNITFPEGNVLQFAYDNATGNRLWQQDGRGVASRVTFDYNATGAAVSLLKSITYPAGGASQAVEQFEYDPNLGNLSATVSPLGTRTTVRLDAIGRDTSDVIPVDSGGAVTLVARRTYDVMDQVTLERTVARGDTVTHVTTYDAEGNPLTAETTVAPDRNTLGIMKRRYAYDLADRRLTDSVGAKLATSSSYDRAGNDTLTLKPGSVSVRTTFDALNRPAQRRALGRVSLFTYDAMGNLVAADNPYGQIRRSYFSNGLVQTDTLRISTTDTTSATRWTSHVYGLVMAYDLNGRRISLSYPGQLLPAGTSGSTSYAYNAQSAALDSVTDPFGNSYRYGYDAMDRLQTYKPASFPADTFSYDLESRLTRRTRIVAGQPTDILLYDLRGKVLANTGSSDAATYLPIGPVKTLGVASEGRTEQYTTDGTGHRRWSSVLAGNQDAATVQWSIFEPVTARLLKTYPLANNPRSDTTFYFYQVDGTRREANAKHFIWRQQGGGCAGSACLDYTEIRNTLDDYDGEGHLATSTFLLDTLAGAKSLPATYKPYRVYTTYRYDALGRRVWARTMRGTNCAAKLNVSAVCVSTVTRTVWDGAQVLFEVRAAGDSLAGSAMEDDASTNPKYGRVGYVHGLGIDAPLALFKGSQLVVPHATWRGVYDRGSCLPSPCPSGLQFPGGNGSASVWGPSGVDPDKADWYGGLIWDQQDATGYQYKRNRYYEPGTGRFTQEDPIGLAGGLNQYGFAAGDPVNFSDAFGLCPIDLVGVRGFLCNSIEVLSIAAGTDLGFIAGGGAGLLAGPGAIVASPAGAFAGAAAGAGVGAIAGRAFTDYFFNSGYNSRTTARTQIGKQNARVDVELPTKNTPGDVHVQTKGPGGKQKYHIMDPNDLSGLPRFLRENETIQRGIQKAFDLLSRFQQ